MTRVNRTLVKLNTRWLLGLHKPMRKQELIHLHELLAEVVDYCASDLDIETEDYRSQGTRPTSINHSKTAHEEAVFALCGSVTRPIRAAEDVAATVPRSEAQPS